MTTSAMPRAGKIVIWGIMTLLLMLVMSGIASAADGPSFISVNPADNGVGNIQYFSGGWSGNYSYITISAVVSDPNGISNASGSYTISVKYPDGTIHSVTPTLTYEAGTNNTRATISGDTKDNPKEGGTYEVSAAVQNTLNNVSTKVWHFTAFKEYPVAGSLTPADGSQVPGLRPTISAVVSDMSSGINQSSIVMKLDNVQVNPTLTYIPASQYSTATGYNVSFTPAANLTAGTHSVTLDFIDGAGFAGTTASWSFTCTPGTQFTSLTPADNTVAQINSYYEYDPVTDNSILKYYYLNPIQVSVWNTDGIANTGYSMSIKYPSGQVYNVTPTFAYGSDNDHAVLTYNLPNNPAEGSYEVTVTVKDGLGSMATRTWSFVAVYDYPTCTGNIPLNTITNTTPVISARLSDLYSGIGTSSISLTLNGAAVTPALYAVSGDANSFDVVYTVQTPLSDGAYDVILSFKDKGGIAGNKSWSFTVQSVNTGPTVSSLAPAAGTTVNGMYIYFSASLNDGDGILSGSQSLSFVTREGNTVTVTPNLTYVDGTSETQAKVSYTIDKFLDGARQLTFSVKDKHNMASTVSWEVYQIGDKPYALSKSVSPASLQPTITARMTDKGSGVDPSTIAMTLNSTPVDCTITMVDTDTYDVTYVPPAPLPENAKYTLEVTCRDRAGNLGSTTGVNPWSFYLAIPPVSSNITPADKSIVVTETPNISIHYFAEDGIDTSSVRLMVDWVTVTPEFNITNGGKDVDVTYPAYLPPGQHYVTCLIKDNMGTESVWDQWTFEQQLPAGVRDMDYTNNTTCTHCHISTTDMTAWNNLHHVGWWHADESHPNRDHPTTCEFCHGPGYSGPNYYITSPATGCGVRCHSGGPRQEVHGTISSYNFGGRENAAYYGLNAPRQFADCVYCHQGRKGSESIVNFPFKYISSNKNNSMVTEHDLLNDHRVSGMAGSCKACHSDTLTREHVKAGRTDLQGNPITCETCHNSSDSTIRNAIKNYPAISLMTTPDTPNVTSNEYSIPGKMITGAVLNYNAAGTFIVSAFYNDTWNTVLTHSTGLFPTCSPVNLTFPQPASKVKLEVRSLDYDVVLGKLDHWQVTPADELTCATCHNLTGANHESSHAVTFNNRCTSCHQSNLMTEHVTVRGGTCEACHENTTNSYVGSSMAWKQTNCSDCHNQIHSQSAVNSVPSLIPVYPSFSWSSPIPAKIFMGEPWITSEAIDKDAMVLISNKLTSVSGDIVWAWYRDNMQQLGWTIASGAPPAGSDYFTVTFTKEDKKAVLWFYGGESPAAGPVISAGYRVTMIYY